LLTVTCTPQVEDFILPENADVEKAVLELMKHWRMADQPEVTDEDVKRVVNRDFGESKTATVMSILAKYGPSPRVHLAILKLATGDVGRLKEATSTAIQDYRDVLAPAEYPRYTREVGFNDIPDSICQAIIDDDWKQYCDWLESDSGW
jgi:hypothetical protein